MNDGNSGALDALIQQKLEADTDFQATLESMSDEEKSTALNAKRAELTNIAFEEIRTKADKEAELARNYKIRAEKAERGEKGDGKATGSGDDLSPKDLYALMQANVPQEDVDEVIKAAKVLGKPITEALKDSVVQTILKTNEEYRKTANATNTKVARPGTKAVTPAELQDKASKGDFPEKGSREAEELFWARRGGKRS